MYILLDWFNLFCMLSMHNKLFYLNEIKLSHESEVCHVLIMHSLRHLDLNGCASSLYSCYYWHIISSFLSIISCIILQI